MYTEWNRDQDVPPHEREVDKQPLSVSEANLDSAQSQQTRSLGAMKKFVFQSFVPAWLVYLEKAHSSGFARRMDHAD